MKMKKKKTESKKSYLRCQSVKTIRKNFNKYYKNDISCKVCGTGKIDSQDDLLLCHRITFHLFKEMSYMWRAVQYRDIFGTAQEQHAVTKVCQALLMIRLRLLKDDQEHRLSRPYIVDQHANSVIQ